MSGHLAPLADPRVRRVAVVRLRVGLGDSLCSVPALRALRAARPDVHVTMVTWAETRPVVARMRAYIDELLAFPGYPGIPERPPDDAALPGFVREVRARGFDLAVQAYGDNAVANQVCTLLGAARVGGFAPSGWCPSAPPITDRYATHEPALHLPYPHHLHEVWRHLRLVELLGVPLGVATEAALAVDELEFPVWEEDVEQYTTLAAAEELAAGRYAVVHPGATSASRRWPPERFAAVADGLVGRGLRVVLTGVPGEEPLTRAVAALMRSPSVDLAGRTTLGSLAVLLRGSALVVGNDTGTAHLAAAVGARTVTVFLSGDPVRWAYGGSRHRASRTQVECNPCRHLQCPIDFRCAIRVSPAQVLAQVDSVLGERRAITQ